MNSAYYNFNLYANKPNMTLGKNSSSILTSIPEQEVKYFDKINSERYAVMQGLRNNRKHSYLKDQQKDCNRIEESIKITAKPSKLPDMTTPEYFAKMAILANPHSWLRSLNCTLLAHCMLYNLEHKDSNVILSALHTLPVDMGVITYMLFNRELQYIEEVKLARIGECILSIYNTEKITNFITFLQYPAKVFSRQIGHTLNAVVLLDNNHKPYVQFIDAYYPKEPLYSMEQLIAKSPAATMAFLGYLPSK